MNKWYLSILLWVHLSSHAAGPAAEKFIFYQPWLSHQQVSAATWNEMGQDLRAQGYTHVIFQWSQYGQNQFWGADKSSLLQRVVQTPGPKAIQYIFGLYLGEDYYAKLGQSDQALSQYLAQSRQFALQNARKIMQQSPRAVAGWYLPEEIDDLNWRTPARQKLLQAHFLALSKELKAIAPNTQIYASAFFGGHTPPADFAKQMNTLLRTTGMILLVQDGLGTGRMNAQQTQRYLQRFTAQLPNQQWHGILETFDIHRVGKEDFFCLTQAKDLEIRKKVWIAATRRPPQAVFSANQLAPSQLNQLACAKARNSANSRQHLPIYKQIIPLQP